MIYPKETQDEVSLQPEHRILTPDSWGTFQRVDFTKVRLLHPPKHSKGLNSLTQDIWHSLINSNLLMFPAMRETWIQSLGEEDPLEKEMATHSSILAWKTPWTEKPGLWSHRVRHDWATSLSFFPSFDVSATWSLLQNLLYVLVSATSEQSLRVIWDTVS